MSNERDLDALYAAVLQDPDGDAPRLAFASACDARGDRDRAEFIRIQIAHRDYLRAKRAAGGFGGTQQELTLERAHGQQWAGPIAGRAKAFGFNRGFVEWIELSASQFLSEADALYRIAPIRKLKLTAVSEVIEPLFRSPHLERIVSLDLRRQHIGDRGVEFLAASNHLRRLAALDLSFNEITSAGLEILAASQELPSLQSVSFYKNPVAQEVEEPYAYDQGQIVWTGDGSRLLPVERRHGRKPWLHPVWERGAEFSDAEL